MCIHGILVRVVTALCAVTFLCAPALSAVKDAGGRNQGKPSGKPVQLKGNSCVECHKTLAGPLGAVVPSWEQSVHGKKGLNCNICHGGNPEILDSRLAKSREFNFTGRPGKRNITEFCGREECHKTASEQFKRSPHFVSVMRRGSPNCVDCHGNHDIQRSSINIISDKTCSDCHSVNYSREIIASIFTIEKDIESLERKIERMRNRNADVKEASEGLVKTRHLFHQMVHVFSRDDIQFTKKILELEIKSLNDDISAQLNVIQRLDFIYIFTIVMAFAIITGTVVYVVWMLARRKK
jgi:hypothetical protein